MPGKPPPECNRPPTLFHENARRWAEWAASFAASWFLALLAARAAFWGALAAVVQSPPLLAFVDALDRDQRLAVIGAPPVIAAIAVWAACRWWWRAWR